MEGVLARWRAVEGNVIRLPWLGQKYATVELVCTKVGPDLGGTRPGVEGHAFRLRAGVDEADDVASRNRKCVGVKAVAIQPLNHADQVYLPTPNGAGDSIRQASGIPTLIRAG